MGVQADTRLMPSLDNTSITRGSLVICNYYLRKDLGKFIPFRGILNVISSTAAASVKV